MSHRESSVASANHRSRALFDLGCFKRLTKQKRRPDDVSKTYVFHNIFTKNILHFHFFCTFNLDMYKHVWTRPANTVPNDPPAPCAVLHLVRVPLNILTPLSAPCAWLTLLLSFDIVPLTCTFVLHHVINTVCFIDHCLATNVVISFVTKNWHKPKKTFKS